MNSENCGTGAAKKLPQIVATLSACLGAFSFGTAMAWTSPALPFIADCQLGDACDFNYSDIEGSWIGSSFTLGAVLSAPIGGRLMNMIGMRRTMVWMAAPFTLGWILILLPYPLAIEGSAALWMFYSGRFLTGVGGGVYTLLAPLYSTETSQMSIRGALGGVMSAMLALGGLFDNGVGAVIHWFPLTCILGTFPMLAALAMLFMPDSPVYLLRKGMDRDAKKSLQWLRGATYDVTSEIQEMRFSIQQQTEIGSISLKDLALKAEYRKPALIVLILMVLMQIGGINAVLFYLTDIFLKADTGYSTELQTIIVCIFQVGGMVFSAVAVERAGRRLLLMSSGALSGISILSLSIYFFLEEYRCNDDIGFNSGCLHETMLENISWLPMVATMIFVLGVNIGMGPIPFVLNGEMYAEEAKTISASLSVAACWLSAFLVTRFTADIVNAVGNSGAYLAFACISLSSVAFVWFCVPETKGKTQEEMRAYFKNP